MASGAHYTIEKNDNRVAERREWLDGLSYRVEFTEVLGAEKWNEQGCGRLSVTRTCSLDTNCSGCGK